MKRVIAFVISLIIVLGLFSGCSNSSQSSVIYLNVYNWEDYINNEDGTNLIEAFEEYYEQTYNKKVVVNYSTFGTCENMYNELQLTKVKNKDGSFTYAYDLVCPSDYMIQRMILEGMVEEFDLTIPEGQEGCLKYYKDNVSSLIWNMFEKNNWTTYSIPYMFGTMGFVYNPEVLAANVGEGEEYNEDDPFSWSFPWKSYSKNLGTIKDSLRDTYNLAVGYVYEDELLEQAEKFKNGLLTAEEYNAYIDEVFNRTDQETVDKICEELKVLKENVYGFEVDSGKRDMAAGKIAINFAWSGDAVYTLDLAEEAGTTLYYSVPYAGSNIWFDGWLMPKGRSEEQKLVAQEFVNFLSNPENAILNMDYIGYTPAIAGEELYYNCLDWYGIYILAKKGTIDDSYITYDENGEPDNLYNLEIEEGGQTKQYEFISLCFDELSEEDQDKLKNEDGTYTFYESEWDDDDENVVGVHLVENASLYKHNVSGILQTSTFTEDVYVHIYEEDKNRQLMTQYPDTDVTNRCSVMRYMDNETMKRLNTMWDEVKVSAVPVWLMVLIVVIIVLAVVLIPLFRHLNKKGSMFEIKTKQKKGWKLISREILK